MSHHDESFLWHTNLIFAFFVFSYFLYLTHSLWKVFIGNFGISGMYWNFRRLPNKEAPAIGFYSGEKLWPSKTYFCEFFKFSLYSVISFGSILSKSFFEWIPFSESFSRNSNSNLMEPISEYSILFFAHLSFAFGWYWTYFVFLWWKKCSEGQSSLYYLIKMTNKRLLKSCYLIFPNHFFFWIIKLEFENLSEDINLICTLIY